MTGTCAYCGAHIYWTGNRWAAVHLDSVDDTCADVTQEVIRPNHTPIRQPYDLPSV